MAEWKKVIVSGSSAELSRLKVDNSITASIVSSSGGFTGSLFGTSSWAISASRAVSSSYALTASFALGGGIFNDQTTYYNTQNTLQITGSTLQTSPSQSGTGTSSVSTGGSGNTIYSFLTSESIYSFNHNTGYPKANSWKENLQGSYFNNFDANTNVSEILRFIAGLLSQSAPDAAPNTRRFTAINPTLNNTSTSSIQGRIPSESTNSDILYLRSKGFANSGSASFDLPYVGRVYSASNFSISYSSSVGSTTTTVTSSNDSQLFGLGTVDGIVYISASTIYKFFSSSNETTPTETSSSVSLITLTGGEYTNDEGAIKFIIPTANPAVIPAGYQDGKFTGSFLHSYNPVTFGNSGSTGWYHFSQSIYIFTGSQNIANAMTVTTASRVFRSSYTQSSFANNSITHTFTIASSSAVSRSLSGAPYLSQSTYTYIGTSSGIFNPMYATASTLYSLSSGSIGGGTSFLSQSSGTPSAVIAVDGRVGTSNIIFSSSGTSTGKNSPAYPSQNDVIKVSMVYNLNAPLGTSGSGQIGLIASSTSSFISASTFSRTGSTVATGATVIHFTPGTFGQPLASGTMAIYMRPQGSDGGTLADSSNTGSEFFTGESFRVKINNTLLTGSYVTSDKFTTGTFDTSALASTDLQVKPGYLVDPGGQYRYWITGSATSTHKYYARAFQRSSNATEIKLNLGKTLINWDDDGTGVAAVLIFSSSGVGSAAGTPRFFDPSEDTFSGLISSSMGTGTFKNPFTVPIDLYGNNTGTVTGTTYKITLYDASQMKLNGGVYKDFILLIRYKGDPLPISGSIITYS